MECWCIYKAMSFRIYVRGKKISLYFLVLYFYKKFLRVLFLINHLFIMTHFAGKSRKCATFTRNCDNVVTCRYVLKFDCSQWLMCRNVPISNWIRDVHSFITEINSFIIYITYINSPTDISVWFEHFVKFNTSTFEWTIF